MKFNEVIKIILPDIVWDFDDIYLKLDKIAMAKSGLNFERKVKKGTTFKVTFNEAKNGFGVSREDGKTKKFHTGIDISYGNDSAFNFSHPRVYSPIYGEIVLLENNDIKKLIGIESFGYLHIFEHFHSIDDYQIGEFVEIGSLLGKMGGVGETGLYHYEQHLHYEIRITLDKYDGVIQFNKEKIDIKKITKEYVVLNPVTFWDNGREFGEYFLEEKETFLEENSNSEEDNVYFQMNFFDEIIDVNGKSYNIGEFIFNNKKWSLLTKGNFSENESFENFSKEKNGKSNTVYDKTHFNKTMSEYKSIKKNKIELMNYAINDGDLNLTLRENYIEVSSDKNVYSRIISANSSKDFKLYNDIFICTELEFHKNKDEEVEEITLKESEQAFKELFDLLKESIYEDN